MGKNPKWVIIHIEEVLCALLFAIMGIIMFVNIISRYLLKYSLAFTEELVVSFFVWMTLLGAAIAFREGSHLGFSFITARLPMKIQKFFTWITASLGAILFLFLILSVVPLPAASGLLLSSFSGNSTWVSWWCQPISLRISPSSPCWRFPF